MDIWLALGLILKDEDAYDKIYNKYHELILYVVLSYVSNREDAEDIAIMVFRDAVDRANLYKNYITFRYFLIDMAINKSIKYLEEKRKSGSPLGLMAEVNRNSSYNRLLNEMSATMSKIDFDALNYRVVFKLSFREIAMILEIDKKEIKSAYREARAIAKREGICL